MLVVIDDSGDPGFKLDRNSSSHFVIAMVIFGDELEAEKTAVAIKQMRRDLGFGDGVEFKFNNSRPEVRRRFLKAVKPFDFTIRALVVDKSTIRSERLKNNKKSFYAYFIKTALQHHGGSIRDAKIRIDGSGDRVFRREFVSYLRRELNADTGGRIVKNVRIEDSKTNVLIQLADMVAGSILRKHAKREPEYRDIVAARIGDEWMFR